LTSLLLDFTARRGSLRRGTSRNFMGMPMRRAPAARRPPMVPRPFYNVPPPDDGPPAAFASGAADEQKLRAG